MARPFVCLVSFALAAAPLAARAQTADAIGIRAQGMAGAFTAVADDATATWWNPAGLAAGPYFNAIVEGGDDHHAGVSFAYPALGLSYYRLRVRQIRASTSTDASSADRQDPGTGDVRLRSLDVSQFGATTGQSLGNHLVVASTLKLTRGAGSTRGGLDLGALATFGPVRLGVTLRNVTEPTLADGPDAFTLRRQVRLGFALVAPGPGSSRRATFAFDADVTKTETGVAGASGIAGEDSRRMAAGVEMWTANRRLGGRAGISWSALGSRRTIASLGGSVAIRSGTYFDVQVSHSGVDDSQSSVGAAIRVTF